MWHHHMWMKMNLFVIGQMFRRVLPYHNDILYKKQDWKCYGDWTKPALWRHLASICVGHKFLRWTMHGQLGKFYMFSVIYPYLLYEEHAQKTVHFPTHVWSCYNLCKACWNWSPFFSWEWSCLLVWSLSRVSLAGNTRLKQLQGSEVTSFSLAAAVDS